MQERRAAGRSRINLSARWETLKTQGRGVICDLSSLGCFVLAGADVQRGALVRLEIPFNDEIISLWGHVVYSIHEMGFALRLAGHDDRHVLDELIAGLGLPNLEC